ncbi:hypothetical protein GCK32_022697, partial [Trichostrongylus colubriformis]
MERLGRVWTRISIRRPNLSTAEPPIDEVDDDVLPFTKNEVFEMFSRSKSSSHRKSEGGNRSRTNIDGTARSSSSPQHKLRASVPRQSSSADNPSMENDETEGPLVRTPSKRLVVAKKHSVGEKRAASFHEESRSVAQNPEIQEDSEEEDETVSDKEQQDTVSDKEQKDLLSDKEQKDLLSDKELKDTLSDMELKDT